MTQAGKQGWTCTAIFRAASRGAAIGVTVVGMTAWMGACASLPSGFEHRQLRPGMTALEVESLMGPATARHRMADGTTRLEFANPPHGKQTWMVDLDAHGRSTRWQQVLDEATFRSITPGLTAEALRQRIGTPSARLGPNRLDDDVWAYRHEAIFCQWFLVSIKAQRVREASMGPDPSCEPRW